MEDVVEGGDLEEGRGAHEEVGDDDEESLRKYGEDGKTACCLR